MPLKSQANTMTTQEFEKLETELELAEDLYRKEFDEWYSMANFPAIEANCRTGWTLWRIHRQMINDSIRKDQL